MAGPIRFRIQIVRLPKKVKPKEFLTKLIRYLDYKEPLAPYWQVELHWQNYTKRGFTRDAGGELFMDAVDNSRSGFNDALRDYLVRLLAGQSL